MKKLFPLVVIIWLLALLPSVLFAQQRTVTGVVTSAEDGSTLPQLSVMLKGSHVGVVTDLDGRYSIRVAGPESVLVFAYTGYETQEVLVGERSEVNVVMQISLEAIDEVVVIGYGATRKRDLSMAVSTIDMKDRIKSRPASLSSLTLGEVPGVTIQLNSGDPMAGGSSINIRGRGSRGDDQVLFVVDGVPGAPFSVQDVESVTILRDAASAAIYGSAVGSGGVVMITTRKAAAGKIDVRANAYGGFRYVTNLPELLTAEQFNQVNLDAHTAVGKPLPDFCNPEKYPYGNVTRTDWLKEIFRLAPLQHYSLSLSGGTERFRSLVSASFDQEDGVMLNTHSRTLNVKADLGYDLTKWLRIGQRATYEHRNGQGNVSTHGHESVFMSAIFFPPSATVYEFDKDGHPVLDDFDNHLFGGTIPRYYVEEGMSGYGEIRNPVATLLRLRQNRPSHRIYSTTTLELEPIKNLVLKSDFTANANISRFEGFSPRVPEIGRPNASNERSISSSLNTKWLWESLISYSNTFADKHYVSAMAAYAVWKENYRASAHNVYNFDREDEHSTIWPNGNDFTRIRPYEEIWDEAMFSVLGRVGYAYDNRYFVNASIRRDASSKLWKENNFGYFPALSAAWKLSGEPFMQPYLRVLSLLKFRGSWGEIGNNNLLPRYPFNVPMREAGYQNYYGNNAQTEVVGIYMATVVNRDLRWERTRQWGVGVDVALWGNFIELTADYYQKYTRDLIEKIPVSQTVGKPDEPWGNVGKVQNNGWEFSAKVNRSFGPVDLSFFGNFSTVENKVLDLGSRKEFIHSQHVNGQFNPLYSKVGQPWYSYYLLQTDGIFQTQEEVDAHVFTDAQTGVTNIIQPNARPGDFKFVDFNNDGKIDDDDRQFMGSYLPKYTYGFGLNLEAYGIDFSVFFQGVAGVKIYNGWKQMGLSGRGGNIGYNFTADVLKSWNYDKESGYPSFEFLAKPSIGGLEAQKNLGYPIDFFLEDASYLRLRSLSLGYTLPQSLMNRMGIPTSSMRFYATGENIFTFTKYSGVTPEVGNYGVDTGTYPISTTWIFGINLTF